MIQRLRAWWHVNRAGSAFARGDFDRAADHLDRAKKAAPDLDLYDQYRGVVELKRGRVEEAHSHLRRAEQAEGDPFILNQALGATDILEKRAESAVSRFRAALDAFPVAYEVGYHIGLSLLQAGKEDEARAAFAHWLSRDDEALFKRIKRLS